MARILLLGCFRCVEALELRRPTISNFRSSLVSTRVTDIKVRPACIDQPSWIGARFEHRAHSRELVPDNLRASAPELLQPTIRAQPSPQRDDDKRLSSGFVAEFPKYRRWSA